MSKTSYKNRKATELVKKFKKGYIMVLEANNKDEIMQIKYLKTYVINYIFVTAKNLFEMELHALPLQNLYCAIMLKELNVQVVKGD